jgi:hypothetical protein
VSRSVGRTAYQFHRAAGSFKLGAREAQTNVGGKLRTEAEDLVGGLLPGMSPDELSPASVPTRLKVPHRARFVPNVWALSADSGFGRSPRRRRPDGSTNQMHDDTTPASEIGEESINNPRLVTSVTSRFDRGDAKNRKRASRNIEPVTSSTQNLYCTDSREEKREHTHTSNSSKIRILTGRGDAPLRRPTAVRRFQRVTSRGPRHDGGDDPSAEVTR